MTETKEHALELFPRDVDAIVANIGMPTFAGKQVLDWIYKKQVTSVDDMSNIAKEKRQLLEERLLFRRSKSIKTQKASDGTIKKLLAWDNGTRQTETVMIPAKGRRTVCVSSQVGCPVGCTFCASGLGGLEGNLDVGQIVEQVVQLNNEPITNVVFMGMGEPMANYDEMIRAVKILTHDRGWSWTTPYHNFYHWNYFWNR